MFCSDFVLILLKCKYITSVPLCKNAMPTENVYFHDGVVTNVLCHGIVTHRLSPGGCANTLLAIHSARLRLYTHDVGILVFEPVSGIEVFLGNNKTNN